MSATVLDHARSFRGLRPLDPCRDIIQVADLIEDAFAGELDAKGKAALRELRLVGRLGSLAGWLGRSWGGWLPFFSGYVWIEEGRVVGNVTVQQSDLDARRWQIANVAVAPAYRGRGIGRALMEAALEHIQQRGGEWAVLQVRADNAIARGLYERLGFEVITGSCEMRRPQPPQRKGALPTLPSLRPLSAKAWQEVYSLEVLSLSSLARWWHPPRSHRFQVTAGQRLGEWLNRLARRERVWRLGIREDGRLMAAVLVRRAGWHPPHRLGIWVHPTYQGQQEHALVAHALSLLAGSPAWEIVTHVNVEQEHLMEALKAAGFEPCRTLITMRRQMRYQRVVYER
ncbi:MAG: GNAT family N-acetyltransferase [Anaerolineae bacterium]|nr:GNAT family N-acetyltransferase [Anaerolineae bacterium]